MHALQLCFSAGQLNTQMQTQYLMAKARNTVTGETVMHRNMGTAHFRMDQRRLAEDFARQYAAKLSLRTQQQWLGYVEPYTPGVNSL